MSKLYKGIRDLATDDATVYAHLRYQEKDNMDEIDIAVALIRSLVQEKKSYFDHAVKTSQMSVVPIAIPKDAVLILTSWERIKLWFKGLI